MKKENRLTLKAIGDWSQIEELIAVLNQHFTVETSSPLLENDKGPGFHTLLQLFEKQKDLEVVQA